MFILNQVHINTDPQQQKGEGSTQKVQTPAPPKSTAQSCCEGHTCSKEGWGHQHQPQTSSWERNCLSFSTYINVRVCCFVLFFEPLSTGISKYVIHFEHLAKRTRCAFEEPQHILKHWNKSRSFQQTVPCSFSVNLIIEEWTKKYEQVFFRATLRWTGKVLSTPVKVQIFYFVFIQYEDSYSSHNIWCSMQRRN